MNSDLARQFFGHARRLSLPAIVGASALFLSNLTASAGIIVESVRYDGHVRNASGSATGVEEHDTSTAFPPPITSVALPATNPPLASGLNPSNNLDIDFDESAMLFSGEMMSRALIWISSASTLDVFANDLDTSLGFPPVEFEATLFLEELAQGDKLLLHHIGIEGGGGMPPWVNPAATTISGIGSEEDPLRVLLGLDADQVQLANRNGQVKIHLYYGTAPVPEPATIALLGIGVIGASGLVSRRRERLLK